MIEQHTEAILCFLWLLWKFSNNKYVGFQLKVDHTQSYEKQIRNRDEDFVYRAVIS